MLLAKMALPPAGGRGAASRPGVAPVLQVPAHAASAFGDGVDAGRLRAGTTVPQHTRDAAARIAVGAGDLVEKRTTHSQVNVIDGREVVSTFAAPVFHRDPATGVMAPIDTTLVPGRGGWVNRAAARQAAFPRHIRDGVRVEVGRGSLTMRPSDRAGSGGEPVVEGSQVTYPDAFGGDDLRYRVLRSGVKEEIVLGAAPRRAAWDFDVGTEGLDLRSGRDGAIDVTDRRGKVVGVIPAPSMSDAASPPAHSTDVRYEVRRRGEHRWRVRVAADRGWLSDPSRKWPVTVDPAVYWGNVGPSADLYVGTSGTDTSGYLSVGYSRFCLVICVPAAAWRTYLAFPTPVLPAGTATAYAELQTAGTTSGGYAVWVAAGQVTGGTSSGRIDGSLVWTAQDTPDEMAWSEMGGADGVGGLWQMNVTEAVARWVGGRDPNLGIVLTADEVSPGTRWARLDSTESGSFPPRIVVYTSAEPPAPANETPADAASVTAERPILGVGEVTDPDGESVAVQYEVSESPTFATTAVESAWMLNGWRWQVPDGRLKPGTTYYWRARAWDGWGSGADTRPSSTWSFVYAASPKLGFGEGRNWAVWRRSPGSGLDLGVNEGNGNLALAVAGPVFRTRVGDVGVSFAYNSLAVANGYDWGLGQGWVLGAGSVLDGTSVPVRARFTEDMVTVERADGGTREFARRSLNDYSSADGESVVERAASGALTLSTQPGNRYHFDSSGLLTAAEVTPAGQTGAALSYSLAGGKLATVTELSPSGTPGRHLRFTYSAATGRLASIEMHLDAANPTAVSRTWTLTGDAASGDRLATVSSPVGPLAGFAYDTAGRLAEVRDGAQQAAGWTGTRVEYAVQGQAGWAFAKRVYEAPASATVTPWVFAYTFPSGQVVPSQTTVEDPRCADTSVPSPGYCTTTVTLDSMGHAVDVVTPSGYNYWSQWLPWLTPHHRAAYNDRDQVLWERSAAADQVSWASSGLPDKYSTVYAYDERRAPYPLVSVLGPDVGNGERHLKSVGYDRGTGGAWHGFQARYWNNTNLAGVPALTRSDAAPGGDWGTGPPAPGVDADGFSARWAGWMELTAPQSSTFCVTADGGVRLSVDGSTVVDQWADGAMSASGTVATGAGSHRVVVEYEDVSGAARLDVQVSTTGACAAAAPAWTAGVTPGWGLLTSTVDAGGTETVTEYAEPATARPTATKAYARPWPVLSAAGGTLGATSGSDPVNFVARSQWRDGGAVHVRVAFPEGAPDAAATTVTAGPTAVLGASASAGPTASGGAVTLTYTRGGTVSLSSVVCEGGATGGCAPRTTLLASAGVWGPGQTQDLTLSLWRDPGDASGRRYSVTAQAGAAAVSASVADLDPEYVSGSGVSGDYRPLGGSGAVSLFGPAPTFAAGETVTSTTSYDSLGRVAAATDPNGNVTSHTYDATNGWPARTQRQAPGSAAQTVSETTLWDLNGNALTARAGQGVEALETRSAFDGRDRVTSATVENGATDLVATVGYDANGQVASTVRVTSAGVEETRTAFDRRGRTSGRTGPDPDGVGGPLVGAQENFAYDALGAVVGVWRLFAPGVSRQVSWSSYDRDGRVATTADVGAHAAGASAVFGYDAAGRRTYARDVSGRESWWGFNTEGNLTARGRPYGDALSATEYFSFDARGRQVGWRDARGKYWGRAYDPFGRATEATDPAGARTVTAFDAAGNPVSVSDPLGNVTSASFDAFGRATSVTYPDPDGAGAKASPRVATAYDSVGRVTWRTEPFDSGSAAGAPATTYAYDGAGRVVGVTGPDPDAGGPKRPGRTLSAYDEAGRPTSVTVLTSDGDESTGRSTSVSYWASGRVRSRRHPGASTPETFSYDAAGREVARTDTAGATWSSAYDDDGRVLSVTNPAGETVSRAYDPAGQLVSSADAGGAVTRRAYDSAGLLRAVTDGAGAVTNLAYDAAGNLTGVSTPVSGGAAHTKTFGYDDVGRRVSFTDGVGETWSYGHDPAGRLVSSTDPLGRVTRWGLDALGRRVSRGYRLPGQGADTTTDSYGYDAGGRVVAASVSGGVAAGVVYDLAGRTVSVTEAGAVSSYGYGRDGSVVSRGDVAGVTGFSREASTGRVVGVSSPFGGVFSYGYDAGSGRLVQRGDPSGASHVYGYDVVGRPVSEVVTRAGGVEAARFTRTFDAAGDVVSATGVVAGAPGGGTSTFGYDGARRLVSWTAPGGESTSYGYDEAGNRTSVRAGSAAEVATVFDGADRAVSSSDGTVLGYDDAGALSALGRGGATSTFSYDAYGRLGSASVAGATVSYGYDAWDRTVTRTKGTTATGFVYEGSSGDPVRTLSGAETRLYARGPGGELLGRRATTTACWWVFCWYSSDVTRTVGSDPHGDVAYFADYWAGTPTAGWERDPWGAPGGAWGSEGTELGFQGDPTDPDTGLVDMGARLYEPTLGAFSTPDDPAYLGAGPTGANLRVYAGDDPVTNTDPDGHFALDLNFDMGGLSGLSLGGLGALSLSGLATANFSGLSGLAGVNFSVGFRDMTNFAAMAPRGVTGLARVSWASSFKASWMNEARFQDSYRAAERRGEVRFANTVLSGLAAPAGVFAETILRSVGVVGPTAGQMRDLYKHPTGTVPVGNQVLGARSIPELYRQEVTARGIGTLAETAVAWTDQALKFAAAGGAATACLAFCAPAAYTASASCLTTNACNRVASWAGLTPGNTYVAEAEGASSRVVIGGMEDLGPGALAPGEATLASKLPGDTGSRLGNWLNNRSILGSAVREGMPIRDASVDSAGNLLYEDTRRFITMERDYLRSFGWIYDPGSNLWIPPG